MTAQQLRRVAPPTAHRHAGRFARTALALGRPQFWLVSLAPYGLGLVLASHALVPPTAELPRAVLGALVTGPLTWFGVLAMNDLADLPGDRLNPRKRHTPVTTGQVSPRQLRWLAWTATALALVVALAVSPLFALGTAGISALGWAYSMRPLRLKERPFADIAANAVALGLFAPLGGWSVLRAPAEFPWAAGALGVLTVAAMYVPTTVIDRASDLAAGYRTSAVRFGESRTRELGVALWVASALLTLVLCRLDIVFPHRLLPVQCVVAVALTGAYVVLTRRPSFLRLEVLSTLLLLGNVIFLVVYTGLV